LAAVVYWCARSDHHCCWDWTGATLSPSWCQWFCHQSPKAERKVKDFPLHSQRTIKHFVSQHVRLFPINFPSVKWHG